MTMHLFTIEEWQNSPSRYDDTGKVLMSTEHESISRAKQIKHIFRMCYQLKLPYTVRYTACVYFHTYCFRRSLQYYDISSISAACIYLASKTEEQRRCVRDVAETAYYYTKNKKAPNPTKGTQFALDHKKLLDALQDAELILMQTLEFNFEVSQPYGYLNVMFKVFKSIYCAIDDENDIDDEKNNNNNNNNNSLDDNDLDSKDRNIKNENGSNNNMAFDIDAYEFGSDNSNDNNNNNVKIKDENGGDDEPPSKRRRLMNGGGDDNNNGENKNTGDDNNIKSEKKDSNTSVIPYWVLKLYFQYAWIFLRDVLKIADCVMYKAEHIAIICMELSFRYVQCAWEEQRKNEKWINSNEEQLSKSHMKHLKQKNKTDILPKKFKSSHILNPSMNWFKIFDDSLNIQTMSHVITNIIIHMDQPFFHKSLVLFVFVFVLGVVSLFILAQRT